MVSINFNPGANTAQSSLDSANKSSNDAINKLASGNRITSAKDDVAGLAVGTTLQSKVQTLKSSSINIEQANSLLQVADGSMKEIGDILKRQSSLAQQASSGALDSVARSFLQEEFSKLESEIDRIAENTNFNNLKLINGDFGHSQFDDVKGTTFSDSNYPVNVSNFKVTDSNNNTVGELHDSKFEVGTGSINGAVEDVKVSYDSDNYKSKITMQVGGKDYIFTDDLRGVNVDYGSITGTKFKNLSINETKPNPGYYQLSSAQGDFNETTLTTQSGSVSGEITDVTASYSSPNTTLNITIGGRTFSTSKDLSSLSTASNIDLSNGGDTIRLAYQNTANTTLQVDSSGDADELASKLKDILSTKKLEGSGTTISLQDKDNNNSIDFTYKNDTNGSNTDLAIDSSGKASGLETSLKRMFKFGSNFQVGTESNDSISVEINNVTSTRLYDEKDLDISEGGPKAQTAKDTIDEAINRLSSARANVGALQSRFEYAGNVVDTATTNQDAARSTFLDADMAQQSTNFAQAQVKTQSSISMLAQANNLPQQLLKLIG
jgi:flagellin